MIMKFDINEEACRLLLGIVYDRLYNFYMKYDSAASDSNSGHIYTQQILTRLLQNDESLQLLLSLDKGKVIAHCLLTIEKPSNQTPYLHIHQTEVENVPQKAAIIAEGMRFAEQLAQENQCEKMLMTTALHPKVFRPYGFDVYRVLMVKTLATLREGVMHTQDSVQQPLQQPLQHEAAGGEALEISPATLQRLYALLQGSTLRESENGTAVGTETQKDDDLW